VSFRQQTTQTAIGTIYRYCSGAEWAPLQDHLLRAVFDPLRCIDIFCQFHRQLGTYRTISYGGRQDEEDDDFPLSSVTILRSLLCWPLLESTTLIDCVFCPYSCRPIIPRAYSCTLTYPTVLTIVIAKSLKYLCLSSTIPFDARLCINQQRR
jgi:hypothetical protein